MIEEIKYVCTSYFLVKGMLSKAEMEFLKTPKKFDANYSRVLRHRIKVKSAQMCEHVLLLQGVGLNVTENCNAVTTFCNAKQSSNQALNVNQWWAEPDLNRRPLARKANVLTRLDDRPTDFMLLFG